MTTALVKISATGHVFRKLVQGQWMVTSFESGPTLRPGRSAPAAGADQRLRRATRAGACPML